MSRLPSYRLLVVFFAVWFLTAATVGVALAMTWKVNGGAVKAVRTAALDHPVTTTTLQYADMPDMSVSVPVPSGEKAVLIVTFSATTRCVGVCFVRALVDGHVIPPLEVAFDNNSAIPGNLYGTAHSIQFVASVPAGQHTVKMQWRTLGDDRWFETGQRTLTVLRSKA